VEQQQREQAIAKLKSAIKKILCELKEVQEQLGASKEKESFLLSQIKTISTEKQEAVQKSSALETEIGALRLALDERKKDHERALAFEEERGRLVARLAETLGQLHSQTELIAELKKEPKTCGPECEARLRKLYEELSSNEKKHQEALEIAYAKFKEFQALLDNKEEKIFHLLTASKEHDQELRKTQVQLAKKVKETTVTTDLLEKQKKHLLEIRTLINKVYSYDEKTI
jgi:chromosome segregation ATPase